MNRETRNAAIFWTGFLCLLLAALILLWCVDARAARMWEWDSPEYVLAWEIQREATGQGGSTKWVPETLLHWSSCDGGEPPCDYMTPGWPRCPLPVEGVTRRCRFWQSPGLDGRLRRRAYIRDAEVLGSWEYEQIYECTLAAPGFVPGDTGGGCPGWRAGSCEAYPPFPCPQAGLGVAQLCAGACPCHRDDECPSQAP